MKLFDPKNWTDDHDYGTSQLDGFAEHFELPLSETNYDHWKAKCEWKRFRKFVKVNHSNELVGGEIDCKTFWKSTLQFRRTDFPNLSLHTQAIITLY